MKCSIFLKPDEAEVPFNIMPIWDILVVYLLAEGKWNTNHPSDFNSPTQSSLTHIIYSRNNQSNWFGLNVLNKTAYFYLLSHVHQLCYKKRCPVRSIAEIVQTYSVGHSLLWKLTASCLDPPWHYFTYYQSEECFYLVQAGKVVFSFDQKGLVDPWMIHIMSCSS